MAETPFVKTDGPAPLIASFHARLLSPSVLVSTERLGDKAAFGKDVEASSAGEPEGSLADQNSDDSHAAISKHARPRRVEHRGNEIRTVHMGISFIRNRQFLPPLPAAGTHPTSWPDPTPESASKES